jgi:hypothetical protein
MPLDPGANERIESVIEIGGSKKGDSDEALAGQGVDAVLLSFSEQSLPFDAGSEQSPFWRLLMRRRRAAGASGERLQEKDRGPGSQNKRLLSSMNEYKG